MVGSYGFVVPDSCAGVSFTVAMDLSCQITGRRIVYGSYGFIEPDSCAGVSLMVTMALSCQSCADESGR